ncbi:methyltransferase domain-containing protein [Spongiimicrobium sp. 3-5]|uniref:class I SAM-dependent methyltransferase n=1 Tax=Spongiimicrobium sp. 3-5 TaxID=3332596 RepID=UPI00398181C1
MKPYLNTKDYSISGEAFSLLYDEELDMLVTTPQPNDLDKYYQSNDYISHSDASESLVEKLYQTVKKKNLSGKVKLVRPFGGQKKTLLDVGAGTGSFMLAAKEAGWSVSGLEPNEAAKNKAAEKGVSMFGNWEDLEGKKFEVITLWHVLEHLPNLEEKIKTLKDLLVQDGILIVAVPNFKSYDAAHYQNFWAAYDVPRHLWHFSKTAIKKLFGKEGLNLFKIRPMIFDAFYVSLLSEKYKTGKQNFAKAFWIGIRSNIKAWRNKEYSSLIYILRKG